MDHGSWWTSRNATQCKIQLDILNGSARFCAEPTHALRRETATAPTAAIIKRYCCSCYACLRLLLFLLHMSMATVTAMFFKCTTLTPTLPAYRRPRCQQNSLLLRIITPKAVLCKQLTPYAQSSRSPRGRRPAMRSGSAARRPAVEPVPEAANLQPLSRLLRSCPPGSRQPVLRRELVVPQAHQVALSRSTNCATPAAAARMAHWPVAPIA